MSGAKRHEPGGPGLRVLQGGVLAAGAVQVLRTGVRIWREFAALRAAEARLRSEWTTIRGIAGTQPLRLHARVRDHFPSRLPPVVLVHGYGVGSSYLVPLAASLAERVHVHAPDLPGHGRSDHDVRPLTIPELAAALALWMEARALRSVLLVGHSLGCQIAAEIAARHPRLVAGLVLVGPTSDPSARTTARTLARGLGTLFFERPTYMLRASRDYQRAGARVLRVDMRQMLSHRLEEVLPRVRAPIRVARGGRDCLVPQPWAETVARLAGAPPPAVIGGWAHAVHYDAPFAVARVVLDLARTVAGARSALPAT